MALTNLSEQMIVLLKLLLWANVLNQFHFSFRSGRKNTVQYVTKSILCRQAYSLFCRIDPSSEITRTLFY